MDTIEYFAIGSMMNPVSLKLRGITPLKSRPGLLKGYKLIFVMANGFAAAKECNTYDPSTDTIHGVLHRLPKLQMETLDKIESLYAIGKDVTIQLYQENGLNDESSHKYANDYKDEEFASNLVRGKVYILNEDIVSKNPNQFTTNPPSERYIDILKEGAKHFGIEVGMYISNFVIYP